MLDGLFVLSLIGAAREIIKEKSVPKNLPPIEKIELYSRDSMSGMSQKELDRNQQMGRYTYPPIKYSDNVLRDKRGWIIIEDDELYNKDMELYPSGQVERWKKEGKYSHTNEQRIEWLIKKAERDISVFKCDLNYYATIYMKSFYKLYPEEVVDKAYEKLEAEEKLIEDVTKSLIAKMEDEKLTFCERLDMRTEIMSIEYQQIIIDKYSRYIEERVYRNLNNRMYEQAQELIYGKKTLR